MMIKSAIAVFLLVVVCPLALAELVPIGEPGESGSWNQRFREVSSVPIDLIGVRMVSVGSAFKSPAFKDLSDASWRLALDGGGIASAWGDVLESLEWDLHFEGSLDDPLVFDYYTFVSDELVSAARCSWGGGSTRMAWFIDPGGADSIDGDEFVPIPVPGASLLGALGLLTILSVWRRTL